MVAVIAQPQHYIRAQLSSTKHGINSNVNYDSKDAALAACILTVGKLFGL